MTKEERQEYDQKLKALEGRIYSLEHPMIYNYIDENTAKIATDCNKCLQKLKDMGVLKGNENGELGLDISMIRMFLINYRAGLYGKD